VYSESLQKLLAGFVTVQRVQRLADATVAGRRHCLDMFFEHLAGIGVADIRAVTRQHIRDYQERLTNRNYSVATVHVHLIALRRLFDHLENADAILVNPCAGLRLPKRADRLPRTVLTLPQVKAILKQPDTQTPKGIRDRAILELFYSTGLRVAEMAALTVHDVDPKNGFARVNQGKGGKDRVTPIGQTACRYVGEYLKEVRSKWAQDQREERALWLSGYAPHHPLKKQLITVMVREYAQAAGVGQYITPHVWRHTCATHLVANGGNIAYVQRLLGHRRLTTTQIYTRVAVPDLKAMYQKAGPKIRQTQAPRPVNQRLR
jgi:integrase/recombinase XerD